MNRAIITVTREVLLSVGDGIYYYRKPAIIRQITNDYILLEVEGHKHTVSWESFYSTQGVNFTLDIQVEEK